MAWRTASSTRPAIVAEVVEDRSRAGRGRPRACERAVGGPGDRPGPQRERGVNSFEARRPRVEQHGETPAYDLVAVDPTTQAFLAALIGAVVAGGAVLAWHVSDRQQRQTTPVEEPVVPPGVATVLSVLRSSAVVVDDNDAVLKASAPAYALGLVRGHRARRPTTSPTWCGRSAATARSARPSS